MKISSVLRVLALLAMAMALLALAAPAPAGASTMGDGSGATSTSVLKLNNKLYYATVAIPSAAEQTVTGTLQVTVRTAAGVQRSVVQKGSGFNSKGVAISFGNLSDSTSRYAYVTVKVPSGQSIPVLLTLRDVGNYSSVQVIGKKGNTATAAIQIR